MGVGSVRESWGWRPDFQPWKPWGGNGNQFDGRAYFSNGLVKNHQLISVEIGEPFFLTILKPWRSRFGTGFCREIEFPCCSLQLCGEVGQSWYERLGNGKNHLLDPTCIFIKGESTHHLRVVIKKDEFWSSSHPIFCEIYCELLEKPSQKWEVDLSWHLANIFDPFPQSKAPSCLLVFFFTRGVRLLGKMGHFPHAIFEPNLATKMRKFPWDHRNWTDVSRPGSSASPGLAEGCQSSIGPGINT